MKTCTRCEVEKELGEFYARRSICKLCLSIERKALYASDPKMKENRQMLYRDQRRHKKLLIWEYLQKNPCVDCGQDDPMMLEFDHRDRAEKSFEISEITRGKGIATMWAEIAKCDVRCANCHRKKTWNDLGWEIPFKDYDWSDVHVRRIEGVHGNSKAAKDCNPTDTAGAGPE